LPSFLAAASSSADGTSSAARAMDITVHVKKHAATIMAEIATPRSRLRSVHRPMVTTLSERADSEDS
jgi:hypothetical protein